MIGADIAKEKQSRFEGAVLAHYSDQGDGTRKQTILGSAEEPATEQES